MAKAYARSDGSPRPWLIYMLEDPRDNTVRYIGKTMEMKGQRESAYRMAARRLTHHLYCASKHTGNYRLHWLRTLIVAGVRPLLHIIEVGEGAGAAEAEQRWIAAGRLLGLPLTNGTKGGEGAPGRSLSEEAKARIGKKASARTGWHHSEETKQKIGAAHRGREIPPERAARSAATQRGRTRDPEAVRKSALGHTGQKRSAETRARISQALRGRKLPEAHKQLLSDLRKQNPTPRGPGGRFQ